MTQQKKRLKRGLDHFISQSSMKITDLVDKPSDAISSDSNKLLQLNLANIQPGKYQPRKFINPETLEELANSIRTHGILQPVVVRPMGHNQYELIAGERRWRAAKQAGLETVPAILKDTDDQKTMALALIENIQRDNLNPIEEAEALQDLIDQYQLTHQQVAEAIGKSRAMVSNLLRLSQLNDKVKQLVIEQKISFGHGKVLLKLTDEQQLSVSEQILKNNLSVRETEKLVDAYGSRTPDNAVKKVSKDPSLIAVERRLVGILQTAVHIQHNHRNDHGKLTIHYRNLQQLEDILKHID